MAIADFFGPFSYEVLRRGPANRRFRATLSKYAITPSRNHESLVVGWWSSSGR
jgi:hypothetical protein